MLLALPSFSVQIARYERSWLTGSKAFQDFLKAVSSDCTLTSKSNLQP